VDAKHYSFVRKNLIKVIEKVCNDHSMMIITGKNSNAVVMMPLEDYNAIEETAYLLRSPLNAERLRLSLHQACENKVICNDLIEK